MNIGEIVKQKLQDELQPSQIAITDQSAQHAGHKASAEGAHLTLYIVSAKFEGLNEIARHRLIYKILSKEMRGAIHALVITAVTPGEKNE